MKPWMIAVGVGVIGVALAALLVPWGQLARDPNPEILVPQPASTTETAARSTDDGRSDSGSAARHSFERPAQPSQVAPSDTAASTPSDAPRERYINPARQEAAERLAQPDMQLITASDMKWQAMLNNIGSRPKDPGAEHALERVHNLRAKMIEYQRDPTSHNIHELMAEQEHILGQMRQTEYWDKDFQAFEQDLDAQWAAYRQETGTKHPYR